MNVLLSIVLLMVSVSSVYGASVGINQLTGKMKPLVTLEIKIVPSNNLPYSIITLFAMFDALLYTVMLNST